MGKGTKETQTGKETSPANDGSFFCKKASANKQFTETTVS